MVSIGRVWDGTTQVLAGRGSTLAGIAALAIFLPTVVRAGYTAYVPMTTGAALIGALIAFAVLLLTIWGQLAIVALSSDPANTRAHATALASQRLPLAIGLVLVICIVLGILLVPAIAVVGHSLSPAALAMAQAGVMPEIPPATLGFVTLYLLAIAIVLLAISARLFVLNPVVVNERLGLGSIGRAFRLTRGITWKLIGVIILYAIVLLVATGAAQAVVGIVFRLILGPNGVATATFLAAVAAAAVTTTLSVVASVFATQVYAAARDTSAPA